MFVCTTHTQGIQVYIIIKLFTVYTFMSCTTMVVKYMYVCHMSCVHILYVKVVCLGTPHEMAIICTVRGTGRHKVPGTRTAVVEFKKMYL